MLASQYTVDDLENLIFQASHMSSKNWFLMSNKLINRILLNFSKFALNHQIYYFMSKYPISLNNFLPALHVLHFSYFHLIIIDPLCRSYVPSFVHIYVCDLSNVC